MKNIFPCCILFHGNVIVKSFQSNGRLPIPVESIVDEKCDGVLQTSEDIHVEKTGQTQAL